MSEQHSRWVGVACLDWDTPALRAHFYPSDVPEDWYLTYYANYAMAVVLPTERWLTADPVMIADWVEQTHDNFWFYLQVTAPDQWDAAASLVDHFAGKLAGVVSVLSPPDNYALPVLLEGQSVFIFNDDQLNVATPPLRQWLQSPHWGDHGLVVLPAAYSAQLSSVHTLMTLLGAVA